jgi:hypothetical protein
MFPQGTFFGFDAAYIINLKHRTDRREEMNEQLESIGFSLSSLCVHLFEAVKPTELAGFESLGAHGCFMSHLGVLQDAKQRGYKSILILEDDVNFVKDFIEKAKPVFDDLSKKNWSIFYGGYKIFTTIDGIDKAPVCMVDESVGIQLAHFVAFKGSVIAPLASYLEEMCKRPSGSKEGGPMHVDGAYFWFRNSGENPKKYNTFISSFQLGCQRSSRTDIHHLRWFDTTPVFNHVVALLRKLKNVLPKRVNIV